MSEFVSVKILEYLSVSQRHFRINNLNSNLSLIPMKMIILIIGKSTFIYFILQSLMKELPANLGDRQDGLFKLMYFNLSESLSLGESRWAKTLNSRRLKKYSNTNYNPLGE